MAWGCSNHNSFSDLRLCSTQIFWGPLSIWGPLSREISFIVENNSLKRKTSPLPLMWLTTPERSPRFRLRKEGSQVTKSPKAELTQLRSGIGSLAWIARQARPDLLYKVSYLQTTVKAATVSTLKECNRAIDIAKASMNEVKLRFVPGIIDWANCGILTVTDASFSNEPGYKSQQGRSHFLVNSSELKDDFASSFQVMPISFSSTTMKRVCRSTLQAEAYALQNGIESGDRLRALIAETNGRLGSMTGSWLLDSQRLSCCWVIAEAWWSTWMRRFQRRLRTSVLESRWWLSANPYGRRIHFRELGWSIQKVETCWFGSAREQWYRMFSPSPWGRICCCGSCARTVMRSPSNSLGDPIIIWAHISPGAGNTTCRTGWVWIHLWYGMCMYSWLYQVGVSLCFTADISANRALELLRWR